MFDIPRWYFFEVPQTTSYTRITSADFSRIPAFLYLLGEDIDKKFQTCFTSYQTNRAANFPNTSPSYDFLFTRLTVDGGNGEYFEHESLKLAAPIKMENHTRAENMNDKNIPRTGKSVSPKWFYGPQQDKNRLWFSILRKIFRIPDGALFRKPTKPFFFVSGGRGAVKWKFMTR